MINDPKEIICSLLLIIVHELKILVSRFEKQNINGKPYLIFKAFFKSLWSNKNRTNWGAYKGKHTIKMTRKTSASSDSLRPEMAK